ncbi:MAG: GAF domain-containing protein [Aequoribacter sp.]|jgi:GAF domain-containing protein|uniref:GAF domain-containing protein n=1 Tax=Aequoribacter sp. TaxID=2847771 RepID=UPI003C51C34C
MFTAQDDLRLALRGLLDQEYDVTANSANFGSLLYHSLPDLNWVGFYWLQDSELVLGAFQGKPACVRIPLGRGVCGTAAATQEPQIVADVHTFPGHIACDADSRSELVLPVIVNSSLLGVLDLDSPIANRFDEQTVTLVSDLLSIWCAHQYANI